MVKRYGVEDCPFESEDGDFVTFEDYATLKAERDALVAENAGMKSKGEEMLREAVIVYNKHNELIHEPWGGMVDHQTLAEFGEVLKEAPSTDRFLADVKAQGVEAFAEQIRTGTPAYDLAKALAIGFAQQLRGEKAE